MSACCRASADRDAAAATDVVLAPCLPEEDDVGHDRVVAMTTTRAVPPKTDQQDERDIRRVVQLYGDGYGTGETGMFDEAFHEEAWIFYTRADGVLGAERLKPRSFQVWASFPRATIRVLNLVRSGDVANVMLVCDCGSEGTWVDLHNLLKIDGAWKITNKTATHMSRAGDATTSTTTPARSDEHGEADIRRVVQLYADGFGSGETRFFEEAFHERAWIFLTEPDSTPRAWPLNEEAFTEWAAYERATIRVLKITRSGDVANVLLVWQSGEPENTWVDLHNLLKIDGVWKITNKTATHISRAGELPEA